jgi:hypothetical protein
MAILKGLPNPSVILIRCPDCKMSPGFWAKEFWRREKKKISTNEVKITADLNVFMEYASLLAELNVKRQKLSRLMASLLTFSFCFSKIKLTAAYILFRFIFLLIQLASLQWWILTFGVSQIECRKFIKTIIIHVISSYFY